MGAVEARQGLHGGQAGEGLVDVHGVELWLVESGLELFGHHHDPELVAVEALRRLRVGEAVALGLGDRLTPVGHHLPGEGHQHSQVVAVLVDVGP